MHKAQPKTLGAFYVLKESPSEPPTPCPGFLPSPPQPPFLSPTPTPDSFTFFFCEAVFLSKNVCISQFILSFLEKKGCFPIALLQGNWKNPCSSVLLTGCLQSAAREKRGHRDLQAWKSQGQVTHILFPGRWEL